MQGVQTQSVLILGRGAAEAALVGRPRLIEAQIAHEAKLTSDMSVIGAIDLLHLTSQDSQEPTCVSVLDDMAISIPCLI